MDPWTPKIKLQLGRRNYGPWALQTRAALCSLGLWGHITGEIACPPAPVPPPPRPPPGTATKEVTDAADEAFRAYRRALDAYHQWLSFDARAILLMRYSIDDRCRDPEQTAKQMWETFQESYQSIAKCLYYQLLREFRNLEQDDDSVEAFYDRFMDVWCKLDSSVPFQDACRDCACCVKRQQHNDKSCLHEFLMRLRPEFFPARARLLDRVRSRLPSVVKARDTLRVEEIRIQSEAGKPSADLKKWHEPIDAIRYRQRQLQALQQGSDSVEAFFNQFMSIRGKLYSLIPVPDVCRSCSCCVKRQEYDDKSCLFDFLNRLRPEFRLARLMLLDRSPLPDMVDALNFLRVKEIQLQIESGYSGKLSAAAPAVDLRCDSCGNYGHTYDTCIKRKKKKNNRKGSRHEKGSSDITSKGSSSLIVHYEPLVGLPFRY